MSSDRLRLVAAGLAALALAGCPGTLNDRAAFEVEGGAEAGSTCDDVPAVVLAPRCGLSTCHSATMPAASLDLVSPDVYARLVGKAPSGGAGLLIDPGGDPQKSVLYLKLTSSPPFGSQMPLTGTKLDATTLACIASWIESRGSIDGSAPPNTDASGSDGAGSDGELADSEPSADAEPTDGSTPEASTMPDAGSKPDSGSTSDATAPTDSSTVPDSQSAPEGGGSEAGGTDAGGD
jgi:hypothetical protein